MKLEKNPRNILQPKKKLRKNSRKNLGFEKNLEKNLKHFWNSK